VTDHCYNRAAINTSQEIGINSGLLSPTQPGQERKFGIRVTLPPADTLRNILGDDWERLHWYSSEQERDSAFDAMAVRHGYYRTTDSPTQILEKVAR
jgi:hypothetical protein